MEHVSWTECIHHLVPTRDDLVMRRRGKGGPALTWHVQFMPVPINNDTNDPMYQYLKSQAEALHSRWIECHEELLEVSDSNWRKVIVDDLREVYEQTKEFLSLHEDDIHPIDTARLKHILSRDLDSHIYVLRHRTSQIVRDPRI